MRITAYELAQRFVGLKEIDGPDVTSPQILAMLQLDDSWPADDSVPWCSAFVNYIAWLLRLPRSKSLRARSWLRVGEAVEIGEARTGFDVVVLARGSGEQPGADVINAPGHVGFFGGLEESTDGFRVYALAGNHSDRVSVERFDAKRVLGVRRLRGS